MTSQIPQLADDKDVKRIFTQLGLCEEIASDILAKANSIRTPDAPSPEHGLGGSSCFSDEIFNRLENLRYTLNEALSLLGRFI